MTEEATYYDSGGTSRQFLALSGHRYNSRRLPVPDMAPGSVVAETDERRRSPPSPPTLPPPLCVRVAELPAIVPQLRFPQMTQLAAGRVWEPGDAGSSRRNWSANSSACWSGSYTQSLRGRQCHAVAVQPSPFPGTKRWDDGDRTVAVRVAIDYRTAKSDFRTGRSSMSWSKTSARSPTTGPFNSPVLRGGVGGHSFLSEKNPPERLEPARE